MRQKIKAARELNGEVCPPGDKSISHRAVILNAISQSTARIRNFPDSDDCLSTVSCMRALGVKIETGGDGEFIVEGAGKDGLREAKGELDAGNSGTTMRLLAGLLAAQPFSSVITGDVSLRSRPMDRIIQPLRLMGAQISGRNDESRAPLEIKGGQLNGINYRLPIASAQIKSALLLAGLYAQGDTVIEEPVPCRDHTERMLKEMGAGIRVKGNSIIISPGSLRAADIIIPGDISSAAFWLVAAAVHPRAKIMLLDTGVNPTRSGIIDVLHSMGAEVNVHNERVLNGEPIADLEIRSSSLNGVEVGGEIIPRLIDEVPLIALAGCIASGDTVIRDARELRVKESDRISATVKELLNMGAKVEELDDGMVVHGGRKLIGSICDSHGDHRLAMMLGVAALIAEGETEIDNAEAADISYPAFWQDMERLSTG